MKREYKAKINALLEAYHFYKEMMCSHKFHTDKIIVCGLSYIYFQAVCEKHQHDAFEIGALLSQAVEGKMPVPFDLSDAPNLDDSPEAVFKKAEGDLVPDSLNPTSIHNHAPTDEQIPAGILSSSERLILVNAIFDTMRTVAKQMGRRGFYQEDLHQVVKAINALDLTWEQFKLKQHAKTH
ncbi:TPA: hypothetical protein ACR599_001865 [Klebsiella variicola]|nr:hypothetical protein [Klebsiella variicola]